MFEPGALGVDSTGNIWVSSYTDPTNTIGIASKFSPTGQPMLPTGVSTNGLTDSYGLAIDASDNVWIPYEKSPYAVNTGLGAVAEFNSSGQSISATGFASGGLNFPIAAAIDPNGTAWIVNYGNASLTTLLQHRPAPLRQPPATPPRPSPFPPPSPSTPATTPGSATRTTTPSPASPPTAPNPFASPAATAPTASPSTSAATSGRQTTSATASAEISSAGTVISSNYTGGGILHPQGIAIDGSGNVWIANYRSPSLAQLAGSASANPGQPISPARRLGPRRSDIARGLRRRHRRQRKPLDHQLRQQHPHRVRRPRHPRQNPTPRPPQAP